jgi:WD40 repeat protein/predicted Ser/Thr protein kinase
LALTNPPATSDATVDHNPNRARPGGANVDYVPAPTEPADATVGFGPGPAPESAPIRACVPGYEILAELGRGGMGVVYKARQVGLNRTVALKMILAGAHASTGALARFRTEAEAVARLQHPGIVQIFEVGEHDGLPFFSLEFVEGGGLDRRLDGTPQDPRSAASMVEAIARAVDAAHKRGVVHRDLKPANVLLTIDGRPKVADFGLAKRLDAEADSGPTESGSIMGTPSYMAPEQARGKPGLIGAATDVYALGAILYDLLTGRPPFRAASPLDTVLLVTGSEPLPPSRLVPSLPRDLEVICLKCLEKEPARRYDSAEALAEDLRRWLEGKSIAARPCSGWGRVVKWSRRRPAVAGLSAAVVLVALLGLAGILWQWRAAVANAREAAKRRDEAEKASMKLEVALQDVTRQRDRAGRSAYLASMGLAVRDYESGQIGRVQELLGAQRPASSGSPDYRAFEWYHLQRLCHSELLSFRGHRAIISDVTFSPDGRLVASTAGGSGVLIWDPETGALARSLTGSVNFANHAAFSPDGGRIAVACGDGTTKLLDARSGTLTRTLKWHTGGVNAVSFRPDGQLVATAGQDGLIKLWDADSGALKASLQGHPKAIVGLAFRPDGKRLSSASQDGAIKLWDVESPTEAHPDPSAMPIPAGSGLQVAAFRPDGRRVATSGADGSVQLRDAETGAEVRTFRGHVKPLAALAFSPDGRVLATAGQDNLIKLWDAESGTETATLRGHTARLTALAFRPDGKLLASAAWDLTVKVWDLARTPGVATIRAHQGQASAVAFSPDGKLLASAGLDEAVRLWNPATGEEVRTLKSKEKMGNLLAVAFSPDGKRLAASGATGAVEVWDLATGAGVVSLQGHRKMVNGLAFSPDGRRIATASIDRPALGRRQWRRGPGDRGPGLGCVRARRRSARLGRPGRRDPHGRLRDRRRALDDRGGVRDRVQSGAQPRRPANRLGQQPDSRGQGLERRQRPSAPGAPGSHRGDPRPGVQPRWPAARLGEPGRDGQALGLRDRRRDPDARREIGGHPRPGVRPRRPADRLGGSGRIGQNLGRH